MLKAINRLMAVAFLTLLMFASQAQPAADIPAKKETKPYKVLTSGKQITIKSNKEIKHVMLWTNGGNRLVEQREINSNSYTFTIPINGSYFFLMVGLADGKIYTEKIGLRE
ncbi:MAG: hypothetical protein ABL876_06880 [Chitinophagaceae bacterium]